MQYNHINMTKGLRIQDHKAATWNLVSLLKPLMNTNLFIFPGQYFITKITYISKLSNNCLLYLSEYSAEKPTILDPYRYDNKHKHIAFQFITFQYKATVEKWVKIAFLCINPTKLNQIN